MTVKTLLKKLNLSQEDFSDVKNAIQSAEKNTSGEIQVAVTAESASYSFWELLFANVMASIITAAFIPLANDFRAFYTKLNWQSCPDWILPVFFLCLYFIFVIFFFYVSNIPFFDRIIIPVFAKKLAVTQRAMRFFAENGVYETKEHSGILIFVSYLEKQVRIIGDKGISAKISDDLWNLIADELAENFHNKKYTEALVNAVSKCGELLAENFPAQKDDPNELSDSLIILEDSEWL